MRAVKKFSDNGAYFKTVDEPVAEIINDTDVKIQLMRLEFALRLLPETRGKSLEQIQKDLKIRYRNGLKRRLLTLLLLPQNLSQLVVSKLKSA